MAGSQLAVLGAAPAGLAQIPVLIQQGFTEHRAEPGTRDGRAVRRHPGEQSNADSVAPGQVGTETLPSLCPCKVRHRPWSTAETGKRQAPNKGEGSAW